METKKKVAGWLAIAAIVVCGFEGSRLNAYLDPVGIPTICDGYTPGVKMGDKATEAQCKSYLYSALEDANKAVEACTAKPMPDYRHAAMVSFAYNAGGSAYCRSTMVRMLNAGDISGACDELIKWVNAGGKRLPGLVKRRTEERIMCLSDK